MRSGQNVWKLRCLHSMLQVGRCRMTTAVGCLFAPPPPTAPQREVLRWKCDPPSSCSFSDPSSRGPRCLCGNKLTGKLNMKVWKEALSSFGGLITHTAPHRINTALNWERGPWIQTPSSRDEKWLCERWCDDVKERGCSAVWRSSLGGVMIHIKIIIFTLKSLKTFHWISSHGFIFIFKIQCHKNYFISCQIAIWSMQNYIQITPINHHYCIKAKTGVFFPPSKKKKNCNKSTTNFARCHNDK